MNSKTVRINRVCGPNCRRRLHAFYCSWEIGGVNDSIGWHLVRLARWPWDRGVSILDQVCQFYVPISQCWWSLVLVYPLQINNLLRLTVAIAMKIKRRKKKEKTKDIHEYYKYVKTKVEMRIWIKFSVNTSDDWGEEEKKNNET